jgi:hypothetical protein
MPRPAPRWAKWSRGVRTRGLRVGLVGGPRPFYFYGPRFFETEALSINWPDLLSEDHPLDFPGKWHNIRHEDELEVIRLRINEAAGHPVGGRFATVAALPSARCGIFSAAIKE